MPKQDNATTGRKPGTYKWFEIQDNVAYYKDLEKPKIIWGNLNIQASFAMDLDKCYLIAPANMLTSRTVDLYYLIAILNSHVTSYFMRQQGYSREGGYVEYKRIFLEQLPVSNYVSNESEIYSNIVKNLMDINIVQNTKIELEKHLNFLIFNRYDLSNEEQNLSLIHI